ncbi:MAG: hypothetical protein OXI93_18465 [Bryobacterales bacterium]|nr:hypothetical protein [Bryobacterales bacterium]
MAFRLEFPEQAERDFGLIFDHLLESYLGFGEDVETAIDHAWPAFLTTRRGEVRERAVRTRREPLGARRRT